MNFKDKTLLITGGTGSFGNAVLTKFLNPYDNYNKYNQYISINQLTNKKDVNS